MLRLALLGAELILCMLLLRPACIALMKGLLSLCGTWTGLTTALSTGCSGLLEAMSAGLTFLTTSVTTMCLSIL